MFFCCVDCVTEVRMGNTGITVSGCFKRDIRHFTNREFKAVPKFAYINLVPFLWMVDTSFF